MKTCELTEWHVSRQNWSVDVNVHTYMTAYEKGDIIVLPIG